MSIGEKLKTCRKEANLTQEHVAEHINVSRQTISNWENNKTLPDIYSLISLSDLYEISLDHLIKGDTIMIKKFKTEKTLKERTRQLVILGCLGIMLFSIGHNDMFDNGNFNNFSIGTGVGLMAASILVMAFSYIRNYLSNRNNKKNSSDN